MTDSHGCLLPCIASGISGTNARKLRRQSLQRHDIRDSTKQGMRRHKRQICARLFADPRRAYAEPVQDGYREFGPPPADLFLPRGAEARRIPAIGDWLRCLNSIGAQRAKKQVH